MTKELDAYAIEDASLETCKRYCRGTDVITERIPVVKGFSIKIMWYKFWKVFYFKRYPKNILWFHWTINKEYMHKTGNIVFRAEDKN